MLNFFTLQPKTLHLWRFAGLCPLQPRSLKTSLESLFVNTPLSLFFPPPSSHLLTRKLQCEALLAGEEVCGELQGDGVEGAVRVLGQRRAAQLPQEHPSVVGTIPYPKHIVDFLRVENQEMQTMEKRNRMLPIWKCKKKKQNGTPKQPAKTSLMLPNTWIIKRILIKTNEINIKWRQTGEWGQLWSDETNKLLKGITNSWSLAFIGCSVLSVRQIHLPGHY